MASRFDQSRYMIPPMQQAVEGQNMRQIFEEAVKDPPSKDAKFYMAKILNSNIGLAFLGTLISMIALVLINPPMVQSKTQGDIEGSKRNPAKVLAWSGAVGVVILAAPFISKWTHGAHVQ